MRQRIGVALALFISIATPSVVRGQEAADVLLVDAVIHTMDPALPEAQALAVVGGEIVALGSSSELVDRYRGPDTMVIDAGGAAVLPGLIDAHGHVMGLGRALRILDLVGTESAEEIAEMVGEAAADRPTGDWITGRGWDQNDWEVREFPAKELLDAVAPDHPVLLSRVDGHAVWVNSLALEAAGVTTGTPDPEGGRIVRDAAGTPSGVLVDNAMALVGEAVPVADREEREAQLRAATEKMVTLGLTGVHDMGVNEAELELYREWAAEGRLKPRIVAYLGADRETLDWWTASGFAGGVREASPHLRVAGVKFYADGAL
ncbi:MAG TPA: amidohydrolase family protein, partial [Gemmatimonadota bacterium]|nr:amidohydrolase family protein [Gemmatimonadota bacterium]